MRQWYTIKVFNLAITAAEIEFIPSNPIKFEIFLSVVCHLKNYLVLGIHSGWIGVGNIDTERVI